MTHLNQKSVICLMGPTASGKTEIAVELYQKLNLSIISVDSAQIYKQMDIGTAKPKPEILAEAPHRLINFVDPSISYSVGEFVDDASREIEDIFANGNIPILVGGTMMYFNSLQNGLSALPSSDKSIRQKLNLAIKNHGLKSLHQKLLKVDPQAASKIHPNDIQRIVRALEVFEITGKPLTQLQQNKFTSNFNFINFKVTLSRESLRARISQRFDSMLDFGLVDEVEKLIKRGDLHQDLPAIKSVGYRQVWAYLNNEIDYSTMRELAITATCQLAKRQSTWLRNWQAHEISSAKEINEILKNLGFAI